MLGRMDLTAAQPPANDERERRSRLEALQAEARQTRARIAEVTEAGRPAIEALEAEVKRLREALEAEHARAATLAETRTRLEAEWGELKGPLRRRGLHDFANALAEAATSDSLAQPTRNTMGFPSWDDVPAPQNGPSLIALLLLIPFIGAGLLIIGLALGLVR